MRDFCKLPKRRSCHSRIVAQNCCWKVENIVIAAAEVGATSTGVTGRLTYPVTGSCGVTGGPWNGSSVGMVGINFITRQQLWVCIATGVAEVGDCLKTRCVGFIKCQCQNRVAVCVASHAPRGLVRCVP